MSCVTVTTQEQLDAAMADEGVTCVHVESERGVWLRVSSSSATVRASGSATVQAYGSATVQAYGSATVLRPIIGGGAPKCKVPSGRVLAEVDAFGRVTEVAR